MQQLLTALCSTSLVLLLGAATGQPRSVATSPGHAPVAVRSDSLFMAAARTAWLYADQGYQPSTGLTNSVLNYPYATMWDIASSLAAMYCADQLDLLDGDEYDRRMRRALATLQDMRLFQGAVYNKNYRTRTGGMAGRNDREDTATDGYGWSATDIGRLLVWLRIIAETQPQYEGEVNQIIGRLDYDRLVRGRYLYGEDVSPSGRGRIYQEGRVGYEQYAAAGFELWGHDVALARNIEVNTVAVPVAGLELVRDTRGDFHLTSEPFVLMGLEVGWDPAVREIAWRILEAQRVRYERTGRVTMLSEDALPDPPHYFYYAAVLADAGEFVVGSMGSRRALDGPHWISVKAAYGWHALLPSAYTATAVDAVQAARTPHGWSSGVYQASGRATRSENINTAALVLEAALYVRRGRPLLYGG